MSSRYVRQMFEQWLQDPALSVPYFGTINQEQTPGVDTWCTASFGATYRDVLTFCNGAISEDGEVEVIYFGRPGIGYDVLIQALEADVALLEANKDPTGHLVILGRSAPEEYSAGSADKEYALSVFFDYQYFA